MRIKKEKDAKKRKEAGVNNGVGPEDLSAVILVDRTGVAKQKKGIDKTYIHLAAQ